MPTSAKPLHSTKHIKPVQSMISIDSNTTFIPLQKKVRLNTESSKIKGKIIQYSKHVMINSNPKHEIEVNIKNKIEVYGHK